jgi:hypothetical protein
MWRKSALLVASAFLAIAVARPAHAAGNSYSLAIHGALLNQFGGTCGAQLGDSYDTFCPSGACGCLQYDDPDKSHFSGNKTGGGKSVTVHFTHDGGNRTGDSGQAGPGCQPVFGQVNLSGPKDSETLYFNGSWCDVQGNDSAPGAVQNMKGGWEIHSSTHGIAAFGSFTGNFQFNNIGFNMSFKGETQ